MTYWVTVRCSMSGTKFKLKLRHTEEWYGIHPCLELKRNDVSTAYWRTRSVHIWNDKWVDMGNVTASMS